MKKRVLGAAGCLVALAAGLALAVGTLHPSTAAASPTQCSGQTCTWGGQGLDAVGQCSADQQPFLHWIFTDKDATAATLTVSDGSGTLVDGVAMTQNGKGSFSYWEYGSFDLTTLQASVTFVGTLDVGAQLVISSGCFAAGTTTTPTIPTTTTVPTVPTTTTVPTVPTTTTVPTVPTTTTVTTTTTVNTPAPKPPKHHKKHHRTTAPQRHKKTLAFTP